MRDSGGFQASHTLLLFLLANYYFSISLSSKACGSSSRVVVLGQPVPIPTGRKGTMCLSQVIELLVKVGECVKIVYHTRL